MDSQFQSLDELFAQLGLPNDSAAITRFIATHGPLPGDVRLEDAPFWSPAQARLLREKLAEDANWSAVIDRLSLALRRPT